MPSLSEDSEDCPDPTRKYLKSYKSADYVRVDGKTGLMYTKALSLLGYHWVDPGGGQNKAWLTDGNYSS